MAEQCTFESVTVSRTEGKEELSRMKNLSDQAAIKIVDVQARGGLVTIVFRRLTPIG